MLSAHKAAVTTKNYLFHIVIKSNKYQHVPNWLKKKNKTMKIDNHMYELMNYRWMISSMDSIYNN